MTLIVATFQSSSLDQSIQIIHCREAKVIIGNGVKIYLFIENC